MAFVVLNFVLFFTCFPMLFPQNLVYAYGVSSQTTNIATCGVARGWNGVYKRRRAVQGRMPASKDSMVCVRK